MNIQRLKFTRAAFLFVLALSLAGCGGGGGSSSAPTPTQTTSLSSAATSSSTHSAIQSSATSSSSAANANNSNTISGEVKANLVVIPPSEFNQAGAITHADGGGILLESKGVTANNLKQGDVIYLPPNTVGGLSMPFAGRVASTSTANGTASVQLVPANVEDVYEKLSWDIDTSKSNAKISNVIAPRGAKVSFLQKPNIGTTKQQKTETSNTVGGGLTYEDSKINGELSISREVEKNGKKFTLSTIVSLKDITFKSKANFDAKQIISAGGWLSASIAMEGTLAGDVKITGEGELNLGDLIRDSSVFDDLKHDAGEYYSLEGLESDDKKGRFPLGGVVVTLPNLVPTPFTGNIPDSALVFLAQLPSVVLWVYVDASGNLTLSGELGARTKDVSFKQGAYFNAVGFDLDGYRVSEGALTGMEIYGNVTAEFNQKLGVSVAGDLFIAGIRPFNLNAFVGGEISGKIKGEGIYSIIPNTGLSGNICNEENIWAGIELNVLFRTKANINVNLYFKKIETGGVVESTFTGRPVTFFGDDGKGKNIAKACFAGGAFDLTASSAGVDISQPENDIVHVDFITAFQNSAVHSLTDAWKIIIRCATCSSTEVILPKTTAGIYNHLSLPAGKNYSLELQARNETFGLIKAATTNLNIPARSSSSQSSTSSSAVSVPPVSSKSSSLSSGKSSSVLSVASSSFKSSSSKSSSSSAPAASLSGVTPNQITRNLTGSFDIAGTNLPTTGISITVPTDPAAVCQAPNNMRVDSFGTACTFKKLGPQTLEVRKGSALIGTVNVTVKTNVTGVTWASPSTTNSGTVKFGETVTYTVAGINLLEDASMGFAVEKCGVSNTEIGTPTNTQRTFQCFFNNEAGAVAGQMAGVVKDASNGQVLFDGWNVAVEVPVATGTIDIPATAFVRGENVALSSDGSGADTLMNAPPYGPANNAAEWDINIPNAGRYELFATYAAVESRPVAISFNGNTAFTSALSATTGGWLPEHRQTISQGFVQLSAGANIMRVSRAGVFPHIKGFSLVPAPLAAVTPEFVPIPGKNFSMSKYETTFAEYDAYAEETGAAKPDDAGWGRGSRPVINVSWNDAVAYAAWLSTKTGKSYRLPTEEEWEFAARAGTTTNYSWGDDIGVNKANCYSNLCGDNWKYTASVGSFAANGFGLFDMHGNVAEWTRSCSVLGCSYRMLRGGSWFDEPYSLLSVHLSTASPANRDNHSGFRLVQYNQDAIASRAGEPIIDLGAYGKLILPVQVEGKWYYHWDRSGDGTSDDTGSLNGGKDYITHSELNAVFVQDISGVSGGSGSTDKTYRYATLNGVQLALPPLGSNGGISVLTGTAVNNGSQTNTTYDDLMAIWDAYNGSSAASNLSGIPTGWKSLYWSAERSSSSGHSFIDLSIGNYDSAPDTSNGYVVLQVL